jgi:hypothetical protein
VTAANLAWAHYPKHTFKLTYALFSIRAHLTSLTNPTK